MVSILGLDRERVAAVVDVRRGMVSVAIMSHRGKKAARILASARSVYSLEELDDAHMAAAAKRHTEEAITTAMKQYAPREAHEPVHTVYAVLRAPLSRSEVVRAHEEHAQPIKVSDATMAALAKEAFATHTIVDPDLLLNTGMHTFRLNGYVTAKPSGKYARVIEISSILSDANPACRASVREAIESAFPIARIVWRSGMSVLFETLRHTRPALRDYLALDVGLEETHILSVRDAEVCDQRIVSEGLRTILERIAPGKPADETLGILRMLGRDACESAACEAIQQAILTAEPDLARIFGDAFGSMASIRHVPNQLIVLAHPDIIPWFSLFLARIDFAQFTITALPFSVSDLAVTGLDSVVTTDTALDPSIAFDAALVNISERS